MRIVDESSHQLIDGNYRITARGCWEWTKRLSSNGYAQLWDKPRKRPDWAHRVSHRAYKGPIPERYDIDHLCQNTACVNPAHLDAVTRVEHVARTMRRLGKDDRHVLASRLRRDGLTYAEIAEALDLCGKSSAKNMVAAAITKGLVDPREVPPTPRLTEWDHEDIRDLYALGVPQTRIGEWFRVDSSQVSRICSGMSSGHSSRGAA